MFKLKVGASIVGVIIFILAVDYFSLFWTSVVREDVRRKGFENTKSYRESKRQDLVRMMFQYNSSEDENVRNAVKSAVRMQFADVDTSEYPGEMRSFISTCFNGGKF